MVYQYDVMTRSEMEESWKEPDNIHQTKNETEENKMGYNANNAEEGKGGNLPKDSILVGVISNITDGVVKEFIPESAKEGWKGDINSPAINIELDVPIEVGGAKEVQKLTQMFTYILENGKTVYAARSNLGKYKNKYNKLPEKGDQVKVITDNNGFGKIKIE